MDLTGRPNPAASAGPAAVTGGTRPCSRAAQPRSAPAGVRVHIKELALRGLPSSDPQQIGESVRAALGRLLAERPLPRALQSDVEVRHVDGGRFDLPANSSARLIGERIAIALFRSWNHG